jgi:pyruvate formate lyase activating enzyme
MFYANKCIGCGKCFTVCPQGAHRIEGDRHIIDRAACVNCGKCADVCYAEALSMCGKPMTVEEIMAQICQDIPYYETSGGGVTLSGGEVLCHRDFVMALTDACHAQGIPVAVETNLSFPYETIAPLLEKMDLIMCDIKIFDEEKHRQYTDVSNARVLENVRRIDELGVPIIVRTPLIPGATDDIDNLLSIARYIKDMKNLRRYELLNFNPLGAQKYIGLDKEDAFAQQKPFGTERLAAIAQALDGVGVAVKII